MKKIIKMPSLKADARDTVLCRRNVEEGEHLSKGEILFEFESDKVVGEFEAEEELFVSRWLAEEGDTVMPGADLCEVETDN